MNSAPKNKQEPIKEPNEKNSEAPKPVEENKAGNDSI